MFHASCVDLKVGDYLIPSAKNGKVYATKEKWQCLIFGRNSESLRDLGSMVSSFQLKNGKLGIEYIENYPYIFENEFKGKSAFVYEVEDDGFVPGGWKVEFYKTEKAKIIRKFKVKDLYTEILKQAELKRYKIKFYTETKEHIQTVINHIFQMFTYGFEIDTFIKLAKEHNAKIIENYLKDLKKLNEKHIASLK